VANLYTIYTRSHFTGGVMGIPQTTVQIFVPFYTDIMTMDKKLRGLLGTSYAIPYWHKPVLLPGIGDQFSVLVQNGY